MIGVDALRALLSRAACTIWTDIAGVPLTIASRAHRVAFAHWARNMEAEQRERLREVLIAHADHGVAYKRHLPANQSWLTKAARQGIDVALWLRPRPGRATVDGREVTIAAVHDPQQIFLMGSYFGTCLSLGDINELSVLANAHDANKQVLFMRDARGTVLARQLVAVSGDFRLLGYHCYVAIDHRETARRERYIAALADYCGRWARRCGLPLADEGEPGQMADHFWYDDGAHPWHEAARQAGAEERPTIHRMLENAPAENIAPVLA